MWYFIFTFLLGASVGSFVNVLIDRTIMGENWVSGRSHCDHCHKTLAWYDMIPVVSFLIYGGRSRCCKKILSYRYPIVELLVGLLFVWWLAMGFWFFQLVSAPLSLIQPSFWLITGVLLAILALADLYYGVVLMPIVWIGVILTAIYRAVLWYYAAHQLIDIQISILVSIVLFGFFGVLYKITKGRGMGDGDMYLAGYIGLLLGWPRAMIAMLFSFVIGAVVGTFLIVTKIRSRKDSLPFVPFMVVSVLIALIWGNQIFNWLY
ncbi:prepilin peptidase [Candidatus Woesebacteria bacterium]|nr:prepilin peptidase [Candidatus Woesebacteria bacterium]